jgi:hypothetical protein
MAKKILLLIQFVSLQYLEERFSAGLGTAGAIIYIVQMVIKY